MKTTKYQDGGRTISEKAATRKSAKGKGYISGVMGANPSGDKGKYVPFTMEGRTDAKKKVMVSSSEMKTARPIKKKGGAMKKMQKGGMSPSDSTRVYVKQAEKAFSANKIKEGRKALSNAARQGFKGKKGYDELGRYKYKTAMPKAQRGMAITNPYKSYGAGKTIEKTAPTITGGQKTKKVSYGPVVPGGKGSVVKTKTNRAGNMVKTSTKMIDQKKAGNKLSRMENKYNRKTN